MPNKTPKMNRNRENHHVDDIFEDELPTPKSLDSGLKNGLFEYKCPQIFQDFHIIFTDFYGFSCIFYGFSLFPWYILFLCINDKTAGGNNPSTKDKFCFIIS